MSNNTAAVVLLRRERHLIEHAAAGSGFVPASYTGGRFGDELDTLVGRGLFEAATCGHRSGFRLTDAGRQVASELDGAR